MLEYEISGTSVKGGGGATIAANKTNIRFDATDDRDNILPNPAELLLSALAACILKNVERYSIKLHIPYQRARVVVHGTRSDVPPAMQQINYLLEVETDANERKLNLLHRNIIKFGTITNTLNKSCDVKGEIKYYEEKLEVRS